METAYFSNNLRSLPVSRSNEHFLVNCEWIESNVHQSNSLWFPDIKAANRWIIYAKLSDGLKLPFCILLSSPWAYSMASISGRSSSKPKLSCLGDDFLTPVAMIGFASRILCFGRFGFLFSFFVTGIPATYSIPFFFFSRFFCSLCSQSSLEKQTKNRNEIVSDLSLGERLMSVKTSKPQALL